MNIVVQKLRTGVHKLLRKGIDSKYFGLCGPQKLCDKLSVTATALCHCIMNTAIENSRQIGVAVFQ